MELNLKSGAALNSAVAGLMARVAADECRRGLRPGGGETQRAAVRPGYELTRVKSGRLTDKGDIEVMTPIGHLTERRKPPAVLSRLGHDHPYVRAARHYVACVEAVGAVAGVDLAGGDAAGGISDGGAVTRCARSAELHNMRRLFTKVVMVKAGPKPRADNDRQEMVRQRKPIIVLVGDKRRGFDPLTMAQVMDGILLDGRSTRDLVALTGRKLTGARPRQTVGMALVDGLMLLSRSLGLQTG